MFMSKVQDWKIRVKIAGLDATGHKESVTGVVWMVGAVEKVG